MFRTVPEIQLTDAECKELAFFHRHGKQVHIEEACSLLKAHTLEKNLEGLSRAKALIGHLIDLELAKR